MDHSMTPGWPPGLLCISSSASPRLGLMRGVDTQKLKERRSGNTVMTGSISSIRLLSFFPRLACFMPGNRG